MGNYNNQIQAVLLMAQILCEWSFGSPHQVKNRDQPRAKGKWNGQWEKVIIKTSYNHVTGYTNNGYNCHEYFFLILGKENVWYPCFLSFLIPLSCNIRCFNFILYQWGLSGKSPAIINIMRRVCATSVYPGSQGEWTGMCMCEQWWLHCTGRHQWGL